jgi:hypothetical protein
VPGRANRTSIRIMSILRGSWLAAGCAAIALLFAACTHLLETNAQSLPDRLDYPGFTIERPAGDGWYMTDQPPESTMAEFKKHADGTEMMIQVARVWPPESIDNADQLFEFASNLPGDDPQVLLENGHGDTCVRHRAHSALTVNDASQSPPTEQRMTTSEDSLVCLDPLWPGALLSFTFSQRRGDGGQLDNAAESAAFIKGIQFDQYQSQ